MKKVLIALTLAVAGVASAQVGIYGRVGTYLDNTKTGASTVQGMANDLSHFGIRATENLGGGLTARATYETGIQANSPDTGTDTRLGDRQSTVGIAHKMGSVDLGRNVHTHFLAISDNDPFGTLIGSSAADVHNLRGLRLSNAAFTSVNFGNFHRIDEYMCDQKLNSLSELPTNPLFPLEDDLFQDFSIHPKDMNFEVCEIDGEKWMNLLNITSSHVNIAPVGRNVKLAVRETNTDKIVGFIRLGSPLILISTSGSISLIGSN